MNLFVQCFLPSSLYPEQSSDWQSTGTKHMSQLQVLKQELSLCQTFRGGEHQKSGGKKVICKVLCSEDLLLCNRLSQIVVTWHSNNLPCKQTAKELLTSAPCGVRWALESGESTSQVAQLSDSQVSSGCSLGVQLQVLARGLGFPPHGYLHEVIWASSEFGG